MIYLNPFSQISEGAANSLYELFKEMVNLNTTNILEVGTYAGQATVQLCGAAKEKSNSLQVISIDENGQLINKQKFIDGNRHGPYEFFYENGQLHSK